MAKKNSGDAVLLEIIQDASATPKEADETVCQLPHWGVISPDMPIGYLLRRFPQTAAVFHRLQLNCCVCVNAETETVRTLSRFVDVPLEELLRELNVAARSTPPNIAPSLPRWLSPKQPKNPPKEDPS